MRAGHEVRATDLTRPQWDHLQDPRAGRGLPAGGPDRRRRLPRARSRVRRRRPHGSDPAAAPQSSARRLRQQPAGDVQRARGGDHSRHPAFRQLLERDRARLDLRPPALRAGVPADRRGAPDPPPGPLRDRQVVRRAADGTRAGARRSRCDLDPALLGAGRRQLRAQSRPDRPRPLGPGLELLQLRRRLRPRRGDGPRGRVRSARSPGRLRRLARHDRRPPARGGRPPPLRPDADRDQAARARPDASAIDSSKARRLLGWEPKRSWRDYLDEQGKLREGVAAPW